MTELRRIEESLAKAGVDFLRTFDSAAGWVFRVDGVTVAQAHSIGLLEPQVAAWWKGQPGSQLCIGGH